MGWDKGFVHEPAAAEKILFIVRTNWPIFIPIGVFVLMFYWWWTKGRDPERDAITVQYEPPDNLSPAECGTLVDSKVAMCDITATLVDLAVKGYLTIEHQDGDARLGVTERLHLSSEEAARRLEQSKAPRATNASRHFRPGESGAHAVGLGCRTSARISRPPSPSSLARWPCRRHSRVRRSRKQYAEASHAISELEKVPLPKVALSDLQNRFSLHLPIIRDVHLRHSEEGWLLRPSSGQVSADHCRLGVSHWVLYASGWAHAEATTTGTAPMPWIVAAILSGIIIAVFGRFMTGRTIAGARAYAKVLGFEDFLGRVEKDQIERLEKTPELFEKYLPYAMALHVEKKWVQAFSGIAMQPPQWYQGAYASSFQPLLLVNDLSVMSSHAGSVMTSSPRSSGRIEQFRRHAAAQVLVTAGAPAVASAAVAAVDSNASLAGEWEATNTEMLRTNSR